jgi:hypothetical protein
MRQAIINMGGMLSKDTEYIVTIDDIEMLKGAIDYPESIKYGIDENNNKYIRTIDELNDDELKILNEAPLEPRTYNGEVSKDKNGNIKMKPKINDRIRFIFRVDDMPNITTGMYEFAFEVYPGFQPTKKLKDFIKNVTNQNIDGRFGLLNLWEFFPEGSKYTLRTKPTLREGKWASFDQTSLKPYKKTSNTSTKSTSEEDVLNLFKEMIKKNGGPIQAMDALSKGASLITDPAEWSEIYKNLKTTGKIVIEDGMLSVV